MAKGSKGSLHSRTLHGAYNRTRIRKPNKGGIMYEIYLDKKGHEWYYLRIGKHGHELMPVTGINIPFCFDDEHFKDKFTKKG